MVPGLIVLAEYANFPIYTVLIHIETDNRAISVQLNLTGTATEIELGNIKGQVGLLNKYKKFRFLSNH